MTDNVVKLGKADLVSERRDAFMQAVSQSFEVYVSKAGYEPEAIVYVLCGVSQNSQIGWQIDGQSQGCATSVLSLAAVHCISEAGNPLK